MMNDTDYNLTRKIAHIANMYDLLVCDFVFPALNCIEVTIPKLLFQHNVEYEIFLRHVKNNGGLKKIIWWLQYVKMRRMERIIARRFDYVVTVSERDMNIHKKEFGIKNIDYVELGVNINEYKKVSIKKEPKSIMFTGTMNWLPNVDAVEFFHDEIFPILKGYTFYAIGKNPIKTLYRFKSDHFIITGTVPDIKPYLFKGMVYVVPLRVGGGTRIKIFEAMAAQIPIVSTTIGAEGLPVTDGENILLRDDPVEFGNAILELSNNDHLHKKISNSAYKLVKENYSWEQIAQKFINACNVTAHLH
jgi:glycosyltransferase involved in cell wall biosynthesis